MLDTYKHRGLRKRLVEHLETQGIADERVLAALMEVPRHFFVEGVFDEEAYEDKALPIKKGQTISQPYTVAKMTEWLDLKPRMKVLEIGTGSGYQAAVLAAMGMKVFSVEYDRSLSREAGEKLKELGLDVKLHQGDGSQGWNRYQPFERIIVTAGSPAVPDPLRKQLEIGGKMVIPVGDLKKQQMQLITRLGRDEYQVQQLGPFRFVPLRGRHGHEVEEGA